MLGGEKALQKQQTHSGSENNELIDGAGGVVELAVDEFCANVKRGSRCKVLSCVKFTCEVWLVRCVRT